ncbi:MAG: NAD-dependent epimerase/dehydratase family protein [Burkholderiales bacterium]
MASTVLILGARGRFGLATARAFAQAGWRVLGQIRPGAAAPAQAGVQWLALDLHDTQALARAAGTVNVVVHGVNPVYTNQAWQAQSLPLLEDAIAVTRTLGATLMLPGNVYNFGPSMPTLLREDTPQAGGTVKGGVRIAMEQRLQHSGVKSVVIRAGDFFGSGKGTWFDTVCVKNLAKGAFTYPGARDITTAWAYLPDLGRAFVAVAEKADSLQPFEVFHFAGHQVSAQRWLDVLTPIARKQGWTQGALTLRSLPWGVMRIGALFVPTWAALCEMRYLWQTPSALANDKLTALIGPEPHTPLEVAAQTALTDLGMINP